jgi:tRNA (guanine-N7-)-methyltransferase
MDPAEGTVGVSADELGPLPDNVLADPASGHVDPRAWFPDPSRRFELEIGSGKGTFLVQQAGLEPETNFLGIEWAGEFYRYAADRVRRRREAGQLTNVRMLHTDATVFLRWRCPPAIIRVIHLYFSDPWPKKRHHKNRVVQDAFLADAWRALEPGGELRVVTDHDDLWAWDEAHFDQWTSAEHASAARAAGGFPEVPFERLDFARPESAGEGELVGTNFERKFRVEGRSFHATVLRKRP